MTNPIDAPLPPGTQCAYADGTSIVLQGGRDVVYTEWPDARPTLAPLRPPVGRGEREPTIRGRDDLLHDLERLLTDDHPEPHVRILYGMGGCGKTTVALEIARRALDRGVPTWWVNAATVESVVAGMQALAVALGADPETLRAGSLPEIVWAHLADQRGRWLLVLDNADDPDQVLGPPGGAVADGNGWVRPVMGDGLVLVTSRDGSTATWGGERVTWQRCHPIRPLAAGDGGAVLMELAGTAAGTWADAETLSIRLGGLPLALRAAGSYLAETASIPAQLTDPGTVCTFRGYHAALECGCAVALLSAGGDGITAAQTRAIISRTWELSLDLLAGRGIPEARPLLRLLACFAPAPIPLVWILNRDIVASLTPLVGVGGNRAWHLLRALAGLGLVDLRDPTSTDGECPVGWTVALHPLVRDTNIAHPDIAANPAGFPTLAARLLVAAVDSDDTGLPGDPTRWLWWQILAPHTAHLRSEAGRPDWFSSDLVGDVCRVAVLAARYLYAAGRYHPAEVEFRGVYDVQRRVLGEDDPDTLNTRNQLACALHAQGRIEDAEAEYRGVLDVQRRVFGDDHLDALNTRNYLACALRDSDHVVDAEVEFRAVLDARRRVFGDDHPDVLNTRHNLAQVLHAQGRLEDAEAEYRVVLNAQRRVLCANNTDTLNTRNYLARVLHDRGRVDEAEAEFRVVLDAQRRALGDSHPDTLDTRHNLAQVLYSQGHIAEAEVEYRVVLDLRRRALGDSHPDTLNTRRALDDLLSARARGVPETGS